MKDLLTIVLGAFIFASILLEVFPEKNSNNIIIRPIAQSIKQVKKVINASQALSDVVDNSLKGTHGEYGLVIKNLKTGEIYTKNENEVFQPASLYKLWVMGTVYEKIDDGTLFPSQKLTRDVKDLNKLFKINEESAEQTEGTISLSVNDALEKMITVSDNYAALLLASTVRNSTISQFIQDEGLSHSRLGEPPATTPVDIALFYEKLYRGEVIDSVNSKKMIELLSRQQLNDRIPKYLPSQTLIAHKTGEIDGYKHDAGIIFASDPILFVALSKSEDPLGAAERIAKLSKDVYYYFEDKTN